MKISTLTSNLATMDEQKKQKLFECYKLELKLKDMDRDSTYFEVESLDDKRKDLEYEKEELLNRISKRLPLEPRQQEIVMRCREKGLLSFLPYRRKEKEERLSLRVTEYFDEKIRPIHQKIEKFYENNVKRGKTIQTEILKKTEEAEKLNRQIRVKLAAISQGIQQEGKGTKDGLVSLIEKNQIHATCALVYLDYMAASTTVQKKPEVEQIKQEITKKYFKTDEELKKTMKQTL